ncbi:MAG: hypothetical protein CO093_04065 [Alphaproteobacteria bacterium CG_4_9_14_3_um_filter_47_13]|nr:MAG: hypothetical protein CO093_04065 [Alphaproteobacteria bacterium CG_4_9_14_3_um_filter_47_13]
MFGTSEIAPKYVEDNSNAPRQILVRPEEKAIGTGSMIGAGAYLGAVGVLLAGGAAATIPDVITAAVFGGGIGGVLAKILGAYLDRHIEKQIEKGGLILWVQTERPEYEQIACDILKKNGAKHVHIHAF